MKCSIRALNIIALTVGLIAAGGLAIAVSTNYWLYTSEVIHISKTDYVQGDKDEPLKDKDEEENQWRANATLYSGLWRMCMMYEVAGKPFVHYSSHSIHIFYLSCPKREVVI